MSRLLDNTRLEDIARKYTYEPSRFLNNATAEEWNDLGPELVRQFFIELLGKENDHLTKMFGSIKDRDIEFKKGLFVDK